MQSCSDNAQCQGGLSCLHYENASFCDRDENENGTPDLVDLFGFEAVNTEFTACPDPSLTVGCRPCADARFGGPSCDTCASPKYTGVNCDQCADPRRTGDSCNQCLAKYAGDNCELCADPKLTGVECDQCADLKFTGPGCDQCVDPKLAGLACDQCADPTFTGTDCDECADPKLTGPECDQCIDLKFTGPACDVCADSKFTGTDCDLCANPGFTGSKCDVCKPKYKGADCDQCADPKHTGPTCDACVDARYAGLNCTECADSSFTGPDCDLIACASSKTCFAYNHVCDVAAGVCVDCLADADCASTSYCDLPSSACLSDVCTPGTASCDGPTGVSTCMANGSGFEVVPCGKDEVCAGSTCSEVICEPGTEVCQGNTVATCVSTGIGYTNSPCGGAQVCVDGGCLDTICEPGAQECQGNTVATCASDGTAWTQNPCGGDAICDQGQCLTVVCAPGALFCDGATVKECNDLGTDSPVKTECKPKGCLSGACKDHVCTPGAVSCKGTSIVTCAADGMSMVETACQAGSICEEQACHPLACAPSQSYCQGNQAMTCNSAGTAAKMVKACGDGVCVDGACVASTCSPGGTSCAGQDKVHVCNPDGLATSTFDCSGTVCEAGVCVDNLGQGYYVSSPQITATLPAPLMTGDATVELWIRRTGPGNNGSCCYDRWLDAQEGAACGCLQITYMKNADAGIPSGSLYVTFAEVDLVAPADVSKWTHIALVRKGASCSLFIGGHKAQTKSCSAGTPIIGATTVSMGWLAKAPGDYEVAGDLDGVRLSSVARYTNDFTPINLYWPDTTTVAIWDFDDGTGTTAVDASGNGHKAKLNGTSQWNPGVAGLPPACDDSGFVPSYAKCFSGGQCTGGACEYTWTSCKEILAAGVSVGTGSYWIDVDGPGPTVPREVTCDMDFAGGGWTRLPVSWVAGPCAGSSCLTEGTFIYSGAEPPAFSEIAGLEAMCFGPTCTEETTKATIDAFLVYECNAGEPCVTGPPPGTWLDPARILPVGSKSWLGAITLSAGQSCAGTPPACTVGAPLGYLLVR